MICGMKCIVWKERVEDGTMVEVDIVVMGTQLLAWCMVAVVVGVEREEVLILQEGVMCTEEEGVVVIRNLHRL